MKTGKTFNSPGFGHWRLMGLFGGLMCLMLAAPVATTVEAQKSSSAPDFNQPSQGQSNEPPKSPQQPSPPQQPPPQTPPGTPPATPPAQPALPPAQPMPEPALPPGQQRIEQPMLPPGTPGGPLPGKEHLQLEAMTLLPPLSRDAGGLPPSAQPISDDAPAGEAPDLQADPATTESENQVSRLFDALDKAVFSDWQDILDAVNFESATEQQLNDLFDKLPGADLADLAALRELANFAVENFDPIEGSHFRGEPDRFGSPSAEGRGSGSGKAPPSGFPSGNGFASFGPGGPFTGSAANYTNRFPNQRGSQTRDSQGNLVQTFTGSGDQGSATGRDVLRDDRTGAPRTTELIIRDNDGGSRSIYHNHETGEYSETGRDGSGSTWASHRDTSTGETVTVNKNPNLMVVKVVLYRDASGEMQSRVTDTDVTTNPGDDATEGEKQMAVWMWSRHNVGSEGGSRHVETGVRVNPGDRGESTGLTGAPSVADVIDVDIAGDPRERAAGQLPANLREQTEQMVRDGAGPGANPGSPDGSQLEEAAPTP